MWDTWYAWYSGGPTLKWKIPLYEEKMSSTKQPLKSRAATDVLPLFKDEYSFTKN